MKTRILAMLFQVLQPEIAPDLVGSAGKRFFEDALFRYAT